MQLRAFLFISGLCIGGAFSTALVVPIHSVRAQSSQSSVTVVFGGDLMFDRTVRSVARYRGGDYLFSCIDSVLQGSDMVVANLEGPITPNNSQSEYSPIGSYNNYVFTFPLSTADLLLRHNIKLVNIGNNHIENFGTVGVESTIAALENAHVSYIGDPIANTDVQKEINGVKISFINYNEFGGSASSTIAQIKEAKKDGFMPVVYTHWGIEYANKTPVYVQQLAHEFVDNGAALIIGSHPHVVENKEVYKGVTIYYSLGNFIFDQYWDTSVMHGLLVEVVFNQQGVETIKEIPVSLGHDRRTCVSR